MDYTRCNTQNCWRSVDAHFQTGAVIMLTSVLLIKAANTLMMGKCCSTARGLYMMQHSRLLTHCWRSVDTLLTLCWRSVDAHFQTGAVTMSPCHLPLKAVNTLIMRQCHSTALGLYKMQPPRLLMLYWRSVDALLMLCGCSVDALLMLIVRWSDIDINHIAYKRCQYFDYG
jgi:hypothetical protein